MPSTWGTYPGKRAAFRTTDSKAGFCGRWRLSRAPDEGRGLQFPPRALPRPLLARAGPRSTVGSFPSDLPAVPRRLGSPRACAGPSEKFRGPDAGGSWVSPALSAQPWELQPPLSVQVCWVDGRRCREEKPWEGRSGRSRVGGRPRPWELWPPRRKGSRRRRARSAF